MRPLTVLPAANGLSSIKDNFFNLRSHYARYITTGVRKSTNKLHSVLKEMDCGGGGGEY